jgi:hypothetical protein
MVIGSNVVQAAITQVDARTGCKFTAPEIILVTAIEDSRASKHFYLLLKTLSKLHEASVPTGFADTVDETA